jgi:hypothetical protein
MRGGRYDFAAGPPSARWPFAVHEARVAPLIAPEFQASFDRILTTTRYYFDVQRTPARDSRKRPSARR